MEKPLITLGVITYNQAPYVAETLEGCFAQTYNPLEILISDDCSTDGTAEIIGRKIADYKASGGQHSVVFHRNEKNLGILRNFEQCFELMHGELLVHNGGDDISYPDRVEKITTAWLNAGRIHKFVAHAYDRIDAKGRFLTPVCMCDSGGPVEMDLVFRLGACVAYSKDICERFCHAFERTSEDWVMETRAYMLGQALDIPERLSKYRFGSGLSTRSFRKSRIGTADRLQTAVQVIWRDLNAAREWLSEERIAAIKRTIERKMKIREDWRHLLAGKTYNERKAAYDAGARLCLPFPAPELIRRSLLLPVSLGDPILKSWAFLAYVYSRLVGGVVCHRAASICAKSQSS